MPPVILLTDIGESVSKLVLIPAVNILGVTPSNAEQHAFVQPGVIVVLTLIMLLSRFMK